MEQIKLISLGIDKGEEGTQSIQYFDRIPYSTEFDRLVEETLREYPNIEGIYLDVQINDDFTTVFEDGLTDKNDYIYKVTTNVLIDRYNFFLEHFGILPNKFEIDLFNNVIPNAYDSLEDYYEDFLSENIELEDNYLLYGNYRIDLNFNKNKCYWLYEMNEDQTNWVMIDGYYHLSDCYFQNPVNNKSNNEKVNEISKELIVSVNYAYEGIVTYKTNLKAEDVEIFKESFDKLWEVDLFEEDLTAFIKQFLKEDQYFTELVVNLEL